MTFYNAFKNINYLYMMSMMKMEVLHVNACPTSFSQSSNNRFNIEMLMLVNWKNNLIFLPVHNLHLYWHITGSAPFQSKYDIITESVMAVVGKESAAVQGVAPFTLDTTFIQLTDTR